MSKARYIKVALVPLLVWVAFAVGLYFDARMAKVCPACRDSMTYLAMRILSGLGVIWPAIVLAHYLVDKWCRREGDGRA